MKYMYLLFMLMLFANCKGQNKNSAVSESPASRPPAFQMIRIPAVLTSPDERAEYLVMHYWDNFNFSDTTSIHLPEVAEQALVDYIDIMPYAPVSVASASVKNMLEKA